MPAFYLRPASLGELIDHQVGRVLDLFGLAVPGLPRWGEGPQRAAVHRLTVPPARGGG